MARPHAVAAVGQAVVKLLEGQCRKVKEFEDAGFRLFQARDFANPMEVGLSFYLYRITPANNVRNLPPRTSPDGRRFRPSVPIDLHYLLIPWARDAFKQQRLLGCAIRVLEDTRVLHASFLNEHSPESDLFQENECLDILMEALSITDIGSIWEVAKPNIQPAVAYVVRQLNLDSSIEMVEADLVQTREFGMGKVVQP